MNSNQSHLCDIVQYQFYRATFVTHPFPGIHDRVAYLDVRQVYLFTKKAQKNYTNVL